jgi:hypothetical protein
MNALETAGSFEPLILLASHPETAEVAVRTLQPETLGMPVSRRSSE